jgi:hypothetical protein
MGRDAFSTACATVAAQLRLQAESMDLKLVRPLAHYKYLVCDQRAGEQAGEMTARCLPDTWSLYDQQLFHAAHTVDLLIVQAHNAAVPLPVLSLEDGHYYRAGTIPAMTRPSMTRRNEQEKRLLISMLALGLEAGDQALAVMSPRNRKRYKTLLQECLKPRPGRARRL